MIKNDETQIDENIEDYYTFPNVSRSIEEAMQDSFIESDSSQSHHEVNKFCDDNYNPDSEQIDQFRNYAKRIEEFKRALLCVHGLVYLDSFYYAILYAICYQFENKKDKCQNDDQLKQDIENDKLCNTLSNLKENLRLDLDIQNFENSVNELLNKNGLFLRVYELKDKFCYLIKQNSEKKTVQRELSSCIIKKVNGFNIVCIAFNKKLSQTFRPIIIIYKPIKKCDDIVH